MSQNIVEKCVTFSEFAYKQLNFRNFSKYEIKFLRMTHDSTIFCLMFDAEVCQS